MKAKRDIFGLSITKVQPSRAVREAAETRLCRTCHRAASEDRGLGNDFPPEQILNSQQERLLTVCAIFV